MALFVADAPFDSCAVGRLAIPFGVVVVAIAATAATSVDTLPFGVRGCTVQCCGGRGNESGDGASKHLLLAKCKFGGDDDTPAGDAKHTGVDGNEWPPGLMRLLLLLLIGIDGDANDAGGV